MALADSKHFLRNGGYLQKGLSCNIRPVDLGQKAHFLPPSRWYRDQKIFDLERRSLFSSLWHVASFTSRFRKPGDYLTCELFGWNFFLIKDKTGNINAFHNICRHRGYPVVQKECGSSLIIACKFHGWTYLPNGQLHKAREYNNLSNFDPKDHSLFPIHTHITPQGFIFVNFDARPTPATSFTDQFGDDFDPNPSTPASKEAGSEFGLFPSSPEEWEYDHTWSTRSIGTSFNWKTFVDGFQECYHCLTGHPTTLPKDFHLDQYYLRQGHGISRHFLPPKDSSLGEAYISWLYPLGAITFSENLLFIVRFSFTGPTDTWYVSETYRRSSIQKPSPEYDEWMNEEIAYWRLVETEDIELAIDAQKGFNTGVLGRGRLHSTQEHAIKWYLDKVGDSLIEHAEMEKSLGRNVDWSIPDGQKEQDEYGAGEGKGKGDRLCELMGPEYEW